MMDIRGIRYINLPADTLRRALLTRLLRSFPYEYRLVPAVAYDPAEPKLEKYLAAGIEPYVTMEPPPRMRGIIGLWISHSMALESIDQEDGITIILEDDFVCKPDFFDVALKMVNDFGRDFDVILFDPEGSGPREAHRIAPGIYQSDGETYPAYHGSHCMFVNNRSVRKILRLKQTHPAKDIDGFLLERGKDLDAFLFYTGKCQQLWLGTNLEGIGPPPVREALAKWRKWTREA